MTAATLAAAIGIVALTTGAGFFLVGFSRSDRSPEETLGWSWGAGTLLLTGAYAALVAIGARPGPKKLGVVLAAAAIAGFHRRSRRKSGPARWDGVAAVFVAIAAAGCAAYAVQAVAEPLWSTDFLAIWGLKAKTIYFTGGVPGRLFRDPATPWSHPEYPLFLPLTMAAFSAAAGAWNDETLGVLYAAWQIATVLVVAGYCRRRGTARAGALAAALVALWHPLYRAFDTGLAEIPFAFSVVLLAAAAADGRTGRSALAALLCAATKQEGTIFVLLLVGVLALRAERRRVAAMIAGTAVLHFGLLRLLRGALHDRDFSFAYLAPSRAAELFFRAGRLLEALGAALTPGALIGLSGLTAAILLTRPSRQDFLLAPLALQLAVYLGACALSVYDPVWQLRTAFFRISAALAPAFALVLGCRLAPEARAAERAPA